jgi:hypothetical protein
MKLFGIIALFVSVTSGLAAADSKKLEFTKADPALVRSNCPEDYAKDAVCWRAKLKLIGNLVVEFVDRTPDGEEISDEVGQAFFEPHFDSRKKLPEALGYYPAPVQALWLSKSPREILIPLLGVKQANLALHGKLARYKYPVEIVLTELTTSIDCDHRNYGMSFSSIYLLSRDVVAYSETKYFGC